MDKAYRKIVKPNNDWFVEFDFNAAELRVMLGLLGIKQPQEDIHEWNLKNVFRGIGTRSKAKERIFAWLYNPKSQDYLSNRAYDRDLLLEKHWDGNQIQTMYNRIIPAKKHYALNYLLQSTAADLFLRQMIQVWKLLQDKSSYIAFALHDSIVIDFSEKDLKVLRKIKEVFKTTELGDFLVNVTAGKHFGSMQRLGI
jgi:hypothetical protein